MTKIERPDVVHGATYTLRWNEGVNDELYYLTINDIIFEGKRHPFEMFLTSKNVTHYAWEVGLSRMVSAVFRRGESVAFVAYELQEVFDPRGAQHVDGEEYKSLLAFIGKTLERHMLDIGYIEAEPEPEKFWLREPPGKPPTPTVEITKTPYDKATLDAIKAKEASGDYLARQHKEDIEDFDVRF
ncbi:hypothetical protein LCGC14_0389410 [marine sediment metagenome]|uniref:ribonucleoside-diphosphate reductase n=1 Tax=marine sediment metagenome TaxID=412755 RepID=A0A0F9T5Q3_9ZZZZ